MEPYDNQHFEKYVKLKGGNSWNFTSYIKENSLDKKKLFWKDDWHFNFLGNKVYAQYLIKGVNSLQLFD